MDFYTGASAQCAIKRGEGQAFTKSETHPLRRVGYPSG
jgi:hypothetical protein